jgi:hypothetical protein
MVNLHFKLTNDDEHDKEEKRKMFFSNSISVHFARLR